MCLNFITKMSRIRLLYILHTINLSVGASSILTDLPLFHSSTPEDIVGKFGYPFENHTVQTKDGYLLSLHRIPYGVKNNKTVRPPVLIMHGILANSADFLILGPEKSIAFLLADAGYDVWLGNNRGNTWSRRHISIDPDKENAKFYNFTLHELGTLDLAAKIDYILDTTKQDNLIFIGHSQGTTTVFILLSSIPEYNDKISMVVALGPVVYLKHAVSILLKLLDVIYNFLIKAIKVVDQYELLSRESSLASLIRRLCSTPEWINVCVTNMFLITGPDPEQLDPNTISAILMNTPAGSSLKQVLHFEQIRKNDRFTQYDFGCEGNLEIYGQTEPPQYNLSQISTPVMLHYALNDYVASFEDVEKLAKELPDVSLKLVPWPKFNHVDYLCAKDVVELLYNEILHEIKST